MARIASGLVAWEVSDVSNSMVQVAGEFGVDPAEIGWRAEQEEGGA